MQSRGHATTRQHKEMTLLILDDEGWLKPQTKVRHAPSPNYDQRPPQAAITLLVIHNISLPPGKFGGPHIIDFFQNKLNFQADPWLERLRGMRVSAHFLIRRDGEIIQFVSTADRAWHAGVSTFQGRDKCNDFSIGIELEGTDDQAYEIAQYDAAAQLTQTLKAHYRFEAIVGHQHIAPERKTDPGPAFDWQAYYLRLR